MFFFCPSNHGFPKFPPEKKNKQKHIIPSSPPSFGSQRLQDDLQDFT